MLARACWNMRICDSIALTIQLCPLSLSCVDQELSPLLHGHVQDPQVTRLYLRDDHRSRKGRSLLQQIPYASLPFCKEHTRTNTQICALKHVCTLNSLSRTHTQMHTQMHVNVHTDERVHNHMKNIREMTQFSLGEIS